MADVQAFERDRAFARGSGKIDFGVERQQGRREIPAEGGEADAAAFRRDVTDIAGGLKAMVVGGAPPFALVIEQAARIEAEIAADRSHVAMGGAGDEGGGLRHHRIVPRHVGMRGEFDELDRGADLERTRVGADRAQLFDVVDVDEHRRGDDAAADIDHEVGAAAEQRACGMVGARADHVVERRRAHERKFRQRVHQAVSRMRCSAEPCNIRSSPRKRGPIRRRPLEYGSPRPRGRQRRG